MVNKSQVNLRNHLIPQVTETNLKWPQMETTQNPREGQYLAHYLEKCHSKKKIMQ